MGFAINGYNMRAVSCQDDCLPGETYHDELPDPWPPAPTESQTAQAKIAELEASITIRRLREAVLGIDGGWLQKLNDQIVAQRAKIK